MFYTYLAVYLTCTARIHVRAFSDEAARKIARQQANRALALVLVAVER